MDARSFVKFEHFPDAICIRHNSRFKIVTPNFGGWRKFKLLSGYTSSEEKAWKSAARKLGWKEEPLTHLHKCPDCGHVWKHDDNCTGDVEAHTCVKCGTESWEKHKSRKS